MLGNGSVGSLCWSNSLRIPDARRATADGLSDAVLTEANLTDQSAACQVSWFGFATIRSTP